MKFTRFTNCFKMPSRSWQGLAIFLGVFCLSLSFISPAAAADGDLDPSFNPGAGAKWIPIIHNQVDYTDVSGKSLIYGYFTTVAGTGRKSIARLNADGSLDTGFNASLNFGEIRDAALVNPNDPGSKIIIAGDFSIGSGGGVYYNLARLNSDGSLDTTFYQTIDWFGSVNSIALQSDGKILAGGYSIAVYGDASATYHLLRFQANGSLDNSYPKLGARGGYVSSVKILPADQARIFGTLPDVSYTHTDYLQVLNINGAKQSGIGDETVNGPILNLGQQGDGKWVAGGMFTQVLGASRNNIVRFNADLTLDNTFNIGTGANGRVSQVTIQGDGKIVLAGNFTSFNGTACGRLVRLNPNGSVDGAFTGGTGADDRIFHMKDKGSGWLIYGAFRSYNGTIRGGIAALNPDGVLSGGYAGLTTDSTTVGKVYTLARQSDGKILIGGDFTGVGGKYHAGLARLNPDGTLDATFTGGVDGAVRNMALQPDGKLLIAGYFGSANAYGRTSLARLNNDGSLDTAFNPIVTKLDGSVSDLTLVKPLSDGKIMVGGHLRMVNSINRTSLARLHTTGVLDTSFDAQINITSGASVRGNRVGEVNDKYVVSGYVTFEGLARGFLTRLTGTGAIDPTFGPTAAPTPSPNVNILAGDVYDMFLQPDGRIMVCGGFSEIIDGTWSRPPRARIARFTADGFLDNTFTTVNGGANNTIQSMALQGDGKILIGGYFTRYDLLDVGQPDNRKRVARINSNGSLDGTFNPGAGVDATVWSVLRLASGKALFGGQFTTYNGTGRAQLAQVIAGPPDSNFCPGIPLLLLFGN